MEVHLHQHMQHGQKQEELEDTVQLENYDIVEIMESVSFAVELNDLNVLFKPK